MAAETATTLSNFDVSVKNERTLMNQLRDMGLEYVSTSGKIIAAKTQPAVFCHCPQKCKTKLPQESWKALFTEFYKLGDQNIQNQFLQSHIVIKAVHLHNWESDKSSPANKRRVTCRYHIPDFNYGFDLQDCIKKKGYVTFEVCQKAFMNCYGITEKRVRMQRERCISRLAPDHYKNSPFGKKNKVIRLKRDKNVTVQTKNSIEFTNGLEITALDVSNTKTETVNGTMNAMSSAEESVSDDTDKEQPLDLSQSKVLSRPNPSVIEVGKSKLCEIAEKIGVSRDGIDMEMAHEVLVRKNLRKQQKSLLRTKKRKFSFEDSIANYHRTEIENRSPTMKAIAEQVVGLGDDLTILPIQTLNNGDLTITPVLGPVTKPVENGDIMRVNSFFQNQLWKPEYIGLSSWRKLRSQSFDV